MKYKTLTTIAIIFAVIALTLACIALPRINKIKHENIELRNCIKQLEVNINIKDIQVKDLQDDITGLNQELEHYTTEAMSNSNNLAELKKEHTRLSIWADLAEMMLVENFIEFRQVE